MTQVIRIALSLFLAVFVVASLSAPSEAQLFRRLRNNIQSNAQQQAQSAPARPQPVVRQPYQVAPQPQAQYGQRLTPYVQTTPQQRQRVSATPTITQPTNAAKPAATVRIVTYYDPRTGRTYRRQYVVPSNIPANTAQAKPANAPVATPSRVANTTQPATGNTIRGVVQPIRPNSTNRFNIPPIQPTQQPVATSQQPVRTEVLPTLSGPTPTVPTANVAAGSIIFDSQVTPAAASSQVAQPTLSSATNSGNEGAAAYSVLEYADDEPAVATAQDVEIEMSAPEETNIIEPATEATSDSAPSDGFDIEIEIETPDAVEAFFGPSE